MRALSVELLEKLRAANIPNATNLARRYAMWWNSTSAHSEGPFDECRDNSVKVDLGNFSACPTMSQH